MVDAKNEPAAKVPPDAVRVWRGFRLGSLASQDFLAALGNPSWYARFAAQVMTDPAYYNIVVKDALTSESLVQVIDGINTGRHVWGQFLKDYRPTDW